MMLFSLLKEALISVAASRLRTVLAMLGIVIGVGSVVLMVAIGTGSQDAIEAAVNRLGSNTLVITPGNFGRSGLRYVNTELSSKDADAIAQLPSVIAAAPATQARGFQATAAKRNWSTRITGTTPDFFLVRHWDFTDGKSFTTDEVTLGKRVAVLGKTVVKNLFAPEDEPLGRGIAINNLSFTVVGILDEKGVGFDGADQDDAIFIPITTAKDKIWGKDYQNNVVQSIMAQIVSKDMMDTATYDITELLRTRRKLRESDNDFFSINNLAAVAQVASDTTQSFSLLLGSIASISLIVGGIGIMNIMLVTVTERTREIGIRKAIGATERQIMVQFLLEALMIAVVGSIVGLLFGFGGGAAAEYWFGIPVSYNLWSILVALFVAATVGIVSGLYPAYKGAKLHPIQALRSIGG